MSIADDDHKLHGILESENLDDYELSDLPMEQQDDTSHVSELPPRKGVSTVLHSGVDPCQGSSLSFIRNSKFVYKYISALSAYIKYFHFELN